MKFARIAPALVAAALIIPIGGFVTAASAAPEPEATSSPVSTSSLSPAGQTQSLAASPTAAVSTPSKPDTSPAQSETASPGATETTPTTAGTEPPAKSSSPSTAPVVASPATPSGSTNSPSPELRTVTNAFLLPNGGTPENVTWPQPLTDPSKCGDGWLQVDVWRGTKEQIDRILEDGKLDAGEDSAVIVSWSFVKQTGCMVTPPPTTPPVTTPPVTAPPVTPPVTTPPVVTPPVTVPPTTPPVVTPPATTPPVTPPATDTPAPSTNAAVVVSEKKSPPPAAARGLASTGSNPAPLVGAALLLLVSGFLVRAIVKSRRA